MSKTNVLSRTARAAGVAVTLGLIGAAPASAAFGIASFGGAAQDFDGNRVTQAGAHADVVTRFEVATRVAESGTPGATDENIKDITVALPPGMVANPQNFLRCTSRELEDTGGVPACPVEAQVGRIDLKLYADPSIERLGIPLYNVLPPKGVAARLAFNYGGVVTNIDASVRTVPEVGLDAKVINASQAFPLFGSTVTLWGDPADPRHDADRGLCLLIRDGRLCPTTAPRKAFVTLPTSCPSAAQVTRMVANTWQNPSVFQSATFDTDFDGFPLRTDGCSNLRFEPSLVVSTSSQPDTPTGLEVNLKSPQNLDNPESFANAHLRDIDVAFPDGLTINPGSADGLQACTDSQLSLGSEGPVSCPAAAKVGSASAKSPLLEETLEGALYVRTQNSDDPESGEMFRIALVLESDERGILVKLPGALKVNRDTGRISASFKNNPQLPVDDIKLATKPGPRAPLATPYTCGQKTLVTSLASWAGHDVSLSNPLATDCAPGLGGFAPTMTAGTATPRAGAPSPFVLSATKPDGNAVVNGLRLGLPAGLLAKLKGNVGRQVGTATTFVGPGSNPYVLSGRVYLEGRYDDAPFSLRVVVPAKAGPFDLGEVVVRQKIYVDPIDAHVTVVSDPIPTVVKGVPIRLQRLEVNIDKPDFIINPTSCAAKTIEGLVGSAAGHTAALSMRFRVSDCAALDLAPGLALSLSGKGQTTDGKHPALTAHLSQPAGQANLKKVHVALPLSLALDPDNANGLCELADGSKTTPTCPKASIVGTATATTPLLDEPLSGPVYFVKNVRKNPRTGRDIKTLPKLVIPLTGQNGIKLTLTGTSAVEDNHLVTTFDNIPDAPVSSFKLNISGGKGGILVVSGADICTSTQVADQLVDGQNGKQADGSISIQTPSCPLKVLSAKVAKRSVTLKIGGLGAGKVTVTGRGVKKATRTLTKATVATIVVRRTQGTPRQIKVSFVRKGAKKAKTTTVKLAAPRR